MFTKSLLILGLAAISSSFTLPDELPNGYYQAYYNEAGEEVHEPVSESSLNTTSSSQGMPKRQYERSSISLWCGCNNPVNAYDTNTANSGMAAIAASYPLLQPGWTYYSIHNTVVSFVCNVDVISSNVPTDVVSTGSWDITQACGLFYAGTSRIEWSQALDYGYMNYQSGVSFCGDAQESNDIQCCNDGSQIKASVESCITECQAEGDPNGVCPGLCEVQYDACFPTRENP